MTMTDNVHLIFTVDARHLWIAASDEKDMAMKPFLSHYYSPGLFHLDCFIEPGPLFSWRFAVSTFHLLRSPGDFQVLILAPSSAGDPVWVSASMDFDFWPFPSKVHASVRFLLSSMSSLWPTASKELLLKSTKFPRQENTTTEEPGVMRSCDFLPRVDSDIKMPAKKRSIHPAPVFSTFSPTESAGQICHLLNTYTKPFLSSYYKKDPKSAKWMRHSQVLTWKCSLSQGKQPYKHRKQPWCLECQSKEFTQVVEKHGELCF